MSLARPADLQIRNSTRERTDYTSLPVTHAVLDEVLLQSRLVSLPKSVRDGDSRVEWWIAGWPWHYESFFSLRVREHFEHCLSHL
jgi:hypothetical protein